MPLKAAPHKAVENLPSLQTRQLRLQISGVALNTLLRNISNIFHIGTKMQNIHRLFLHQFICSGHCVWLQTIVSVSKHDILHTFRNRHNALGPAHPGAAVHLIMQIMKTRVSFTVFPNYLRAAVCGTVVYQPGLPKVSRLLPDTVQTNAQIIFIIIYRNYQCHLGLYISLVFLTHLLHPIPNLFLIFIFLTTQFFINPMQGLPQTKFLIIALNLAP